MKKYIFLLFSSIFLLSCNDQQTGKSEKNNIGVEEKSLMILGNEKQYVEITGESAVNPVLLFIHGGPGWPQTPQLRYFNADLTKSFILATWDQRGCGKSYLYDSVAPNLSLEQIVADAHELTQFLKEKFHQQKIYLAGFSWGSSVGLMLAQKYPEDYLAYIGISQVIDLNQGMQVTQKWLAQEAGKVNDTATLHILEKLGRGDTSLCNGPLSCFMKQYELVTKYKGAVFNPVSDKEVEKAMTKYEDYKNYDWNKGFMYSASRLEKDMFSVDFFKVTKLEIPVYFMEGRHDWNVPAVLVEQFVQNLQVPHKEIVWFEKSGHGPLEEEPDTFNRIMIEKLIK